MKKKALLLPVAAMAVMASNAYAFNPESLAEAGLSNDQIAAFEAAQGLRSEGKKMEAREILAEAGVDQGILKQIKKQQRSERKEVRHAVREAVVADDYEAFLVAVANTPLAEKVVTQDDFEQFVAKHEERKTRRGAIREAIEARDYDAFRDAAADTRLGARVSSEADFATFLERHEERLEKGKKLKRGHARTER